MFDIPKIESEEITALLDLGKRGGDILASLKKNITFIDVFNTPIGNELLRDLVKKGGELLSIIADPEKEATLAQRSEYKIVRSLIETWATRIENYLNLVGQTKKVTTTHRERKVTK